MACVLADAVVGRRFEDGVDLARAGGRSLRSRVYMREFETLVSDEPTAARAPVLLIKHRFPSAHWPIESPFSGRGCTGGRHGRGTGPRWRALRRTVRAAGVGLAVGSVRRSPFAQFLADRRATLQPIDASRTGMRL